jgi:hypothetical protein
MAQTLLEVRKRLKNGSIVDTSNSTPLSELFEKREKYNSLIKVDNVIDLWYDKTYYGRVNYEQQVVVPLQTSIKELSNSSVSLLAPAADAYEELKKRIIKDANIQKFKKNSNYYPLNPSDGYKNYLSDYTAKVRELFDYQSLEYVKVLNKRKNIKNLEDYINNFIELSYYTNTIVTISNFILSQTPLYSGLVLDLKNEDKTSDKTKQVNYLEDPNFEFFVKRAEEYGFKVDKNIPWRIVFDIESINARKYLEPYGLTNVKQFFEKFYEKTINLELRLIQEEIIRSYNNFVKYNPKYIEVVNCEDVVKYRLPLILEQVNIDANELRWNKFHMFLKLKELNMINSEEEYTKHMNNLSQIYFSDKTRLTEYVEKETKFLKANGSNPKLSADFGLTSSKVDSKLYIKF